MAKRTIEGRATVRQNGRAGQRTTEPRAAKPSNEPSGHGGSQVKLGILARWRAKRRAKQGPRIFDRTLTSLYIDDSSLKVVTTKGRYVTKWADIQLEPGLVSGGVITDPAAMAGKIRALFTEKKIKGKKVIAGLSGLHCLSRVITLPSLGWSMLPEAVRREAERELPVSLENLYLAWQVVGYSKDKLKVFLIAYARNSADVLVETLRRARLKPYLMDLAPLAITRVVNRKAAVIADVRPSELDITIMVDGIPELVRSLALSQEKPVRDQLPVIQGELDRTIKFFNSIKWERPPEDFSVFVSGELAREPELYQALSDQLGLQVSLPLPPLKYGKFQAPGYMVNIGLILKELYLGSEARTSKVNLNVLPAVYRPKRPSAVKVLAIPGALLATAAVVWVTLLAQNAGVQTDSLRRDMEAGNQVVAQRQAEQRALRNAITELEKKLADYTQTYNTLTAAASRLVAQQQAVYGDLVLATNVPAGMSITTLKHSGSTLSISGVATGEPVVLSYAAGLAATGRYEVVISNLGRGATALDFTLTLKVR